jgi:uncharacterized protein YggE
MYSKSLYASGLALMLSVNMAWADIERTVTVSGTGSVSVTPDIAQIRIAINERNPSIEIAQQKAAEATARVLQLIDKLDIERKFVVTTGATVRPDYRWNRTEEQQELLGYIAARSIDVELHNLDQLGKFIEGAVQAGVNEVASPVLEYSGQREAYRQALARAAEDARDNAATIATALDAKLGKVLELSTVPGQTPPQPMLRMQADAYSAEAAPQTYNAGNIRYEATLTATFELTN